MTGSSFANMKLSYEPKFTDCFDDVMHFRGRVSVNSVCIIYSPDSSKDYILDYVGEVKKVCSLSGVVLERIYIISTICR